MNDTISPAKVSRLRREGFWSILTLVAGVVAVGALWDIASVARVSGM